jgi:hypothetical protein
VAPILLLGRVVQDPPMYREVLTAVGPFHEQAVSEARELGTPMLELSIPSGNASLDTRDTRPYFVPAV